MIFLFLNEEKNLHNWKTYIVQNRNLGWPISIPKIGVEFVRTFELSPFE